MLSSEIASSEIGPVLFDAVLGDVRDLRFADAPFDAAMVRAPVTKPSRVPDRPEGNEVGDQNMPGPRSLLSAMALMMLFAGCSQAAPSAGHNQSPVSGATPSHAPSPTFGLSATASNAATPSSTMPSDDHTGDPVTYAGGQPEPRAPLTSNAAAAQVMKGLSGEPRLAGITTTSTGAGLHVAITLTRNDDRVQDVWLADLAVGAVGELVHSDQAVANDLISGATAVGPGKGGDPVTTYLGVGAVRLGQVFGSPSDATLVAHVAAVAKRHGLEVVSLQILHPLESAMSVTFVVPDGAPIDWTIDALRTALVGKSPDVEGVLIELDDSHGQALLQSGVSYRTGEGGLWFASGQDERFGAVHGGTPGN